MSGKNDRLILGGLIAIAVIAVAGAAAAFGYGAYVFAGGPGPSPSPQATPTPAAPTPAAATPAAGAPVAIETVNSSVNDRTYEVNLALRPGAAAVDVRRMTAEMQNAGNTYQAWDYDHYQCEWSAGSNRDTLLEAGETFTMVIYTPQAGLPIKAGGPVKLTVLLDAAPIDTTNVTAV